MTADMLETGQTVVLTRTVESLAAGTVLILDRFESRGTAVVHVAGASSSSSYRLDVADLIPYN